MNEWVRLTPGDDLQLALFALPLPSNGWYVAEGYSWDARDDAVRISEEEALAFAMLLPKIQALVEAAQSAEHQLERNARKWEAEAEYYPDAPGLQKTRLTRMRLCEEESGMLQKALAPFKALLDD